MTQDTVLAESAPKRGLALVVDDEPANRLVLQKMLRSKGFDVLTAESGAKAIELFAVNQVDIVFMDVMMPGMDGYQATRQIKSASGENFVPVIFLTALSDVQAIEKAVASGGDDVLGKPINFAVLNTRIMAMERVRNLHRTIAEKHQLLGTAHEQMIKDERFAETIFRRVLADGRHVTDFVSVLQRSATTFCGDVVLSSRLSDGRTRVLVADFTGHGLAAAVGAIPVSDVFRQANEEDLDDFHLLQRLNGRLYRMLPSDIFMAACLVTLDTNGFYYWNGGMPPAYLKYAARVEELKSGNLPLGILPALEPAARPVFMAYEGESLLVLSSDGLNEACGPSGRHLGECAVKECVMNATPSISRMMDNIDDLIADHVEQTALQDDLTVVVIDLASSFSQRPVGYNRKLLNRMTVEVLGEMLRAPELREYVEMLSRFGAIEADLIAIETITAELFNNALDHGLLALDSSLKCDAVGFATYYEKRNAALAATVEGCITLRFSVYEVMDEHVPQVTIDIEVADSGGGFDSSKWTGHAGAEQDGKSRPWGRGIALVSGLCKQLRYNSVGNVAMANYELDALTSLNNSIT